MENGEWEILSISIGHSKKYIIIKLKEKEKKRGGADLGESGEAADGDEIFPKEPEGRFKQVKVIEEVDEEAGGDDGGGDEEEGERHGTSDGKLREDDVLRHHSQRLYHYHLLLPLLCKV